MQNRTCHHRAWLVVEPLKDALQDLLAAGEAGVVVDALEPEGEENGSPR
jgi:hypothetical protein